MPPIHSRTDWHDRYWGPLRIIFQMKLLNDRVEEKQSETDPFGRSFGKDGRPPGGEAISARG